jgi:putative membrane protein
MNRSLLLANTIFCACLATTVAALADSPREFLQKAQQGNNSEIMLGRLAAERARNPAVREFGQTLVSDHRQARDEVRALGARFGVRPNRAPSAEAIEERETLMSMGGRRFDREFIRYMVEDHEKDITEFREEAREGNGALRDLARRQLPTLQHHLEMARSLNSDDGRFRGRYDQTNDRQDWRNRPAQNDTDYRNAERDDRGR